MTYKVANSQALGSRDEQQDAAGFSELDVPAVAHAGVLAVLADGMGGMSSGQAAGQLTVRSFLEAYRKKPPAEFIPHALQRSLMEANRAVLTFARTKGSEGQIGATVVAATIKGRELYWISAGDSRAYLARGRAVYRLTVDHTWGNDSRWLPSVTSAPLIAPGAHVDPEAVSSFMGLPGSPRTDANNRPVRLAEGDFVLLASDGLYRTLSEKEIGALIEGDVHEDCERLVRLVVERAVQDQDNVTVMAMKYRD